ncbi:hypothetical protein Y032_0158g3256 [Ancylostoma ceylanicum]|uniref:Uncharacterized protein n=1 Tax=Ancylostoma ceylanicum TaxID=53326 RepID=A0A016SZ68_9BILA|nr:hypothetical protein Y032_0158g3256 [Ancylostoma ceylanicum]
MLRFDGSPLSAILSGFRNVHFQFGSMPGRVKHGSEMSAMFSTSRSSQGGSSSGNLVEFKVDLISTKTKS